MKRRRHDQVGCVQQVGPRIRHPTAEHGKAIAPTLVVEAQNEVAGHVAISQRRPRPVISRRMREAGEARLPRIDRDIERRPAAGANRVQQELELRPEIGLQRARPRNLPVGDQ